MSPAPIAATAEAPPTATLSFREKVAYASGNFASVLYWQTFAAYLSFFYTDVLGLTAAMTAAVLGLSRSLDAFVDPVMGLVADRTESRWGRFRPYLLWLCVPLAVAGVLAFTVPALGPTGRLVWAIVTYNSLMLLYTGINIPYLAMIGVMTPHPAERLRLSANMLIGAFAAGNLISWTLLPLTRWVGGGQVAAGWRNAFLLVGVVATGCFLVTFANTRERIRPPQTRQTPVREDLRDLLANAPWLILLVVSITFMLFGAVRASVSVHYFKYFVGTQTVSLPSFLPLIGGRHDWSFEYLISAFNGLGQAASLVSVLLMPFLTRLGGPRKVFFACLSVGIVCTAAFYFLGPGQLPLILLLNTVSSFCGGLSFALLWPMCADTADYGEWKRGRRATGLVLSAAVLVQKQGWAIGSWIALALLDHFGFVANQAPTPRALHGLVLLMSLIPAAFGVLCVIVMFFYPLTEAEVHRIASELEVRRAAPRPVEPA